MAICVAQSGIAVKGIFHTPISARTHLTTFLVTLQEHPKSKSPVFCLRGPQTLRTALANAQDFNYVAQVHQRPCVPSGQWLGAPDISKLASGHRRSNQNSLQGGAWKISDLEDFLLHNREQRRRRQKMENIRPFNPLERHTLKYFPVPFPNKKQTVIYSCQQRDRGATRLLPPLQQSCTEKNEHAPVS